MIPQDDISQAESESIEAIESAPSSNNPLTLTDDYHRLSRGLLKWAERHEYQNAAPIHQRRNSSWSNISPDVSLHDLCDSVTQDEKERQQTEEKNQEKGVKDSVPSRVVLFDGSATNGVGPSKDRFANRVLGRLYNRRTFASGLVFSRGHFLGDIEKMVEGLLSLSQSEGDSEDRDDLGGNEGVFDNADDALSLETMTIHELDSTQNTAHSSTLAAGKDGCVVLVLPKARLTLFLDQHPGLLLSLLGTQVVV
jgi:CRP-like cAMP-binding protein